jgi:TonB family protein
MFCSRCGVECTDETNFCPSCGLDLAATTPIAAIRDREVAKPEKTELDVIRDALKDDYTIEKELGRGGMAIVYQAVEKSLDREVALKVLPFSLSHDEEFVERFQREARTAAKLEHPNIIPIYRVGKTGNVIYFAMKFLRGQSLADVLSERGAMPPDEIRPLLKQCAGALGYANHHGIVHRDIKPDNIMYSDRGVAVVTDFGIAKAATGTRLTGTGMAIGTPYYMSPEQARAQKVDGRSDLYSLGVVAFQCMSGSVPFDGEDSFSIGYKHIMEEVPPLALKTPDERALYDVICRMMAKDPNDRYQTAEELVAALEGREVSTTTAAPAPPGITDAATVMAPAPPTGGVPTAGPAAPSTPTTPMPQSLVQGQPKKKRSGMLVGAAALIVVGGLGGGLYYTAVMGNSLPVIGNPFVTTAVPAETGSGGTELAAAAMDSTSDSTQAAASDTLQQLAANPDSIAAADSAAQDTVTAQPEPEPEPPPPGALVLAGVPEGATVTVDGSVRSGTRITLTQGNRRLVVRADGYEDFAQSVRIRSGQATNVSVEMTIISQCELLSDSYNADGSCFDQQPRPLAATFVPLTSEIEGNPSTAMLGIRVNPDGSAAQVQIITPSDIPAFNILALEFARALQYNPAQKDGQPVVGWTRQIFYPQPR